MIRFFQFALLLLGLSLVALASAIVTMRFAIHGAEIKVPSFKGMTAAEARGKAAELGVEMSIDNRFFSAEVPAGRILAQSPAPGTVVRSEWHIRTTESLGPQLVAIPDLIGQPERAATLQLRRLGLDLGSIAHMPVVTATPGTVVAQDPPPGAAGVERPSVSVIVADPAAGASAEFVMPDFIGQPYAGATTILSRAGMKLAPSMELPLTAIPPTAVPLMPGTVISQNPPAGYKIEATTPIELTVAR